MKIDMLLSVIIPIYNVDIYLDKCLSSVINQTYRNLEILLINDGSTDNSLAICNKYTEIDERIIVISKLNGGLSSARNCGIKNSSGVLVGFIDSDDWIEHDTFEILIRNLTNYNADVSSVSCVATNKRNVETKYLKKEVVSIYNTTDILKNYLEEGIISLPGAFSFCRNIYKKELFEGVLFPEGKINEDIFTNFRVLSNANIQVVSNLPKYYYYQHVNSISNSCLNKNDFDLLFATRQIKRYAIANDFDLLNLIEHKYCKDYFSLMCKMALFGVDDKFKYKNRIKSLLRKKMCMHHNVIMTSKVRFDRKIIFCLYLLFPTLTIFVMRHFLKKIFI